MCNSPRRSCFLAELVEAMDPSPSSDHSPLDHLDEVRPQRCGSADANSDCSGSQRASTASDCSFDSVATVASLKSLMTVINEISQGIAWGEALASDLTEWASSLIPELYQPDPAWDSHVKAQYQQYKVFKVENSRTRKEYFDYYYARPRKDTTHDQFLELVRLAIEWGQVALKCAQGRLEFLNTYRNAYPDTKSIFGHITAAESHLLSSKNAVERAKEMHRDLWYGFGRSATPSVFT
ncbi:hypothetical protein E4U21_007054 [Claviceps maximensis]|nr:hypothetical protein E4U21_007054 [Claviceps maximensis]